MIIAAGELTTVLLTSTNPSSGPLKKARPRPKQTEQNSVIFQKPKALARQDDLGQIPTRVNSVKVNGVIASIGQLVVACFKKLFYSKPFFQNQIIQDA